VKPVAIIVRLPPSAGAAVRRRNGTTLDVRLMPGGFFRVIALRQILSLQIRSAEHSYLLLCREQGADPNVWGPTDPTTFPRKRFVQNFTSGLRGDALRNGIHQASRKRPVVPPVGRFWITDPGYPGCRQYVMSMFLRQPGRCLAPASCRS
jgi:hypothetical protein